MLVGGKLVACRAHIVEELRLFEVVKSHRQGRGLADRQTECAGGDGGRDDDLAALVGDEGGGDDRAFGADILFGEAGRCGR